MNNEQFEQEMQFLSTLASPPLIEQIRARDTAQREALARVEAENRQLALKVLEIATQRDTAQAQLAEAVGLLIELKSYGYMLPAIDNFLASYVPPEQQKAQPRPGLGALATRVGAYVYGDLDALYYDFSEAQLRTFAAALARHAQAEQQKAQGAQAGPANFGQELEAFEKWRHTQADSLRRCGYPDGADAFIRLGSVQWVAWQARAALATQPAAGEPVYQSRIKNNGEWRECSKQAYEQAVGYESIELRILWTAPPAAAPVAAGEPVEVIATLSVDDHFPNSGVSHPHLAFVWEITPQRQRELVKTMKVPMKLVALNAPPAAAHGDEAVRIGKLLDLADQHAERRLADARSDEAAAAELESSDEDEAGNWYGACIGAADTARASAAIIKSLADEIRSLAAMRAQAGEGGEV